MKRILLVLVPLLVACDGRKVEPPSTHVRAAAVASLPANPDADAWKGAPVHRTELRPQDMVDPRKMTTGVPALRVQALHDGRSVSFRLAWEDASDDRIRKPATFGDACAVQVPAAAGPDLPAPQMGEAGKPVSITYWSAAAQEGATKDGIGKLYPNAHIDHYPFEAASLKEDPAAAERMAAQYSPARALGNAPQAPVQDLTAEGPGTLRPAKRQVSTGTGARFENGWVVVITRPLPEGVSAGAPSHVSFAIWNGTAGDTGSRKMWTPWIGLALEGRETTP